MPRAVYDAELRAMLSRRMHPRAVFVQHIEEVFGCCVLESADVSTEQQGSLGALYTYVDGVCTASAR